MTEKPSSDALHDFRVATVESVECALAQNSSLNNAAQDLSASKVCVVNLINPVQSPYIVNGNHCHFEADQSSMPKALSVSDSAYDRELELQSSDANNASNSDQLSVETLMKKLEVRQHSKENGDDDHSEPVKNGTSPVLSSDVSQSCETEGGQQTVMESMCDISAECSSGAVTSFLETEQLPVKGSLTSRALSETLLPDEPQLNDEGVEAIFQDILETIQPLNEHLVCLKAELLADAAVHPLSSKIDGVIDSSVDESQMHTSSVFLFVDQQTSSDCHASANCFQNDDVADSDCSRKCEPVASDDTTTSVQVSTQFSCVRILCCWLRKVYCLLGRRNSDVCCCSLIISH
jgi:hypothetical protein